ncbi:MAG: GH39 family glycosyl hydrolase [Acidimicrobiales bacterium]
MAGALAAAAPSLAGATPVGTMSPSAVTVTVDTTKPGAPVNEHLIGTNQPVAGAGPVMAPLGVDWGRVDMGLDAAYDCATKTADFSALDARVAADKAMGPTVEPELLVDYSPPCMTKLGQGLEPPDAGNYGPWFSLVKEAASHEITTQGVRIFEVWNEPDGTFWYGTLADYLAMYQATVTAIEQAAAAAGVKVLVGGPALLYPDPSWIEPLLAYVTAQHLPLDFLSWHYYGDYPSAGPVFPLGPLTLPPQLPAAGDYWYNPGTRAQTYGEQVTFVKGLLAAYPQLHPLTVLDEWNIDAGYDPRSDTSYDAAFAAAVLDSVQQAGLDRMAFFRVADDRPGTLGNWGMLFSDLTPKPVYDTFLFWHELAGAQLPVTLPPSQLLADPVGRIGADASSTTGAVHVLLYDYAPYDPTGSYGSSSPTPYDHLVRLVAVGVGAGRPYQATIVSGSGQHVLSGVTDASGAVELLLPGESVAFVTLQP